MEHDPIIQRFLHDLEGPAWIAKRVEVLAGVVDSEVVYVTPTMDRLYGYVWPDTIVGHHISAIHMFEDAQITRQYSVLRHWGFDAPRHYVMRGLHPNGRIFRVIKHVAQHTVDGLTVWVTHHEPWHRSTSYPCVMPLRIPPLQPEALRAFVGDVSVAHVQHAVPLLRDTPSLERLRARLRAVDTAAPPTVAHVPSDLHHMGKAVRATLPTLGLRLRHARQAQGLSQQALAQRCTQLLGQHVTPKHVSGLECGHCLPSLPLFHVLTIALDLDPAAVLTARLETPDATPDALSPESHARSLGDQVPQDLLTRVQHTAHHLDEVQQAHHEALVAARQAGASWRQLATATGLSSSRIRQLLGRTRGLAEPTSPMRRPPS